MSSKRRRGNPERNDERPHPPPAGGSMGRYCDTGEEPPKGWGEAGEEPPKRLGEIGDFEIGDEVPDEGRCPDESGR